MKLKDRPWPASAFLSLSGCSIIQRGFKLPLPAQSIYRRGPPTSLSHPVHTGQSSIIDAPIIWFTGQERHAIAMSRRDDPSNRTCPPFPILFGFLSLSLSLLATQTCPPRHCYHNPICHCYIYRYIYLSSYARVI